MPPKAADRLQQKVNELEAQVAQLQQLCEEHQQDGDAAAAFLAHIVDFLPTTGGKLQMTDWTATENKTCFLFSYSPVNKDGCILEDTPNGTHPATWYLKFV